MAAEILILRLIHILGGIFWLGGAVLMSFFLMPALASAGEAAGQVMAGLQRRRLMTAMPVAAGLTLLSGIRLMWIGSAAMNGAYFESPTGRTFAIGGILAILAFTVGMFFARPAMMRAGRIAAGLAQADPAARAGLMADAGRLRQRGARANLFAVILLIGAAAAMAVARYV